MAAKQPYTKVVLVLDKKPACMDAVLTALAEKLVKLSEGEQAWCNLRPHMHMRMHQQHMQDCHLFALMPQGAPIVLCMECFMCQQSAQDVKMSHCCMELFALLPLLTQALRSCLASWTLSQGGIHKGSHLCTVASSAPLQQMPQHAQRSCTLWHASQHMWLASSASSLGHALATHSGMWATANQL
jgi:hypothetical protein